MMDNKEKTLLNSTAIALPLRQKALVMALSAVLMGVTSPVIYASDVSIYQNAEATNYPILMLAIDNSSSMGSNSDATYNGSTKARIDALKLSLTNSDTTKGALGALIATNPDGTYKIDGSVRIGISVFASDVPPAGVAAGTVSGASPRLSKILVPAAQLDSLAPSGSPAGVVTHRDYLVYQIKNNLGSGSTPTPLLLAETYAYLWGNTTYTGSGSADLVGLNDSPATKYSNYTTSLASSKLRPGRAVIGSGTNEKYIAPISQITSDLDQQCSTQGILFLTDGAPVGIRPAVSEVLMKNALGSDGASFSCAAETEVKPVYYNYSNLQNNNSNGAGTVAHNGEFAEMAYKSYLDSQRVSPVVDTGDSNNRIQGWQDRSSWQCIGALVRKGASYDKTSKKRIYFSTIGYGGLFTDPDEGICTEDHCVTTVPQTGTTGVNKLNADMLKLLGKKIGEGDTYGTVDENGNDTSIGGYTFADSGEKVQAALNGFLNKLKQPTFGPASIGTYVVPADQLETSTPYPYVFAPQFQPHVQTATSSQQLWTGNVKKYKVSSTGTMVDAANSTVLDSNGQVISTTRDLWNPATSADGDSAVKGGALANLTIPNATSATAAASDITTRPLWIDGAIDTTTGSSTLGKVISSTSLTKLTSTNVLQATATDTTQTTWKQNIYQPYLLSALGYKIDKAYLDAMTTPYAFDLAKIKTLPVMKQMGGVLHSDPLLITLEGTYGTDGKIDATSRKDYILFGTMQGLVHMVKAGTSTTTDGGQEVMSFLPNEILQDQGAGGKREGLLTESLTARTSSATPYYGVDGAWASWVEYGIPSSSKFTATKANVYGGMRMGGSNYYGLNVKEPTAPALLFKVGPVAGTDTENMGQSWSKPTIAKIRYNNQVKTVMIVGGGYDPVYETDGYQPTSSTTNKGGGVYMFDATTGALIWSARYAAAATPQPQGTSPYLRYSVVSQIKVLDRNSDGLVDHLYFGDLGGQVFRVDLNNSYGTSTAAFGDVVRLGNFTGKGQRFYERPAVTIHNDAAGRFAAVSIASGNRSFPLNKTNVVSGTGYNNRVYVILDRDVASSGLYASTSKKQGITEDDMLSLTASGYSSENLKRAYSDTAAKLGWYYELKNSNTSSFGAVKALNGYIAVANTGNLSDLYVSTYDPELASSQQPTACTGGIAGASKTVQFCLPYGNSCTLNDTDTSTPVVTTSTVKTDGISKLNISAVSASAGEHIQLLNDPLHTYSRSKKFTSIRWYEKH